MLPLSFKNILSRTATATVVGTAAVKITPTATNRAGLDIFNTSATYDLYIRPVARGAAAPTMAAITDANYVILPEQTAYVAWGESIDVYAINSSGAATTTTAVVTELA